MHMGGGEIEAISVTPDGEDDTGEGGGIGGNFLEHLLEGLPGRLAEQAGVLKAAMIYTVV